MLSDRKVYYNASGFLLTGDYKTLSIVLHENYFYDSNLTKPDYFNFYGKTVTAFPLFLLYFSYFLSLMVSNHTTICPCHHLSTGVKLYTAYAVYHYIIIILL